MGGGGGARVSEFIFTKNPNLREKKIDFFFWGGGGLNLYKLYKHKYI